MKYLILSIMLLFTQLSFAECDWGTVERQGDNFVYSEACHVEVGKLYKKEVERKEQVKQLEKTITLKDLSLNEANKRIDNWRSTTYKLEDRVFKQKKYNKYTNWAYYGLGVLSVVLGGYAIGQAAK